MTKYLVTPVWATLEYRTYEIEADSPEDAKQKFYDAYAESEDPDNVVGDYPCISHWEEVDGMQHVEVEEVAE